MTGAPSPFPTIPASYPPALGIVISETTTQALIELFDPFGAAAQAELPRLSGLTLAANDTVLIVFTAADLLSGVIVGKLAT